MSARITLLVLLLAAPLLGASSSVALDDLRINLADTAREVKCQKGEIELLHDKLSSMQTSLDNALKEVSNSGGDGLEKDKWSSLEKRIGQIEKSNKTLVSDLKTLKDHLNESSLQLAKCQDSLSKLDHELNSDIKSLKSSMQSMLSLLQGGDKATSIASSSGQKNYTVKPGDSLGKIAQDHHTTIRELKTLNSLEKDQIVVGQKLQVP
jgi:LysM repeat protein